MTSRSRTPTRVKRLEGPDEVDPWAKAQEKYDQTGDSSDSSTTPVNTSTNHNRNPPSPSPTWPEPVSPLTPINASEGILPDHQELSPVSPIEPDTPKGKKKEESDAEDRENEVESPKPPPRREEPKTGRKESNAPSPEAGTDDSRRGRPRTRPGEAQNRRPLSTAGDRSASTSKTRDPSSSTTREHPSVSKDRSRSRADSSSRTRKQPDHSSYDRDADRGSPFDACACNSCCNPDICCYCFSCCTGCSDWRIWLWLRRYAVYPISLTIVVLMLAIGLTGPITGIWFCRVSSTKLGATGSCSGSKCRTTFWKGVPAVSKSIWPGTQVLSGILIAFGAAGGLALLLCIYQVLRLWCCRTNCDTDCVGSLCYCCFDAQGCTWCRQNPNRSSSRLHRQYGISKEEWDGYSSGQQSAMRSKSEAMDVFDRFVGGAVAIALVGILVLELWLDDAQATDEVGAAWLMWLLLGACILWFVAFGVYRSPPGTNRGKITQPMAMAEQGRQQAMNGARRTDGSASTGGSARRRDGRRRDEASGTARGPGQPTGSATRRRGGPGAQMRQTGRR